MAFTFKKLDIDGFILVEPKVFPDERGFFLESYKESEFAAQGITERFVQDNHSLSKKGVLRGIHFQRDPRAQGKLVRVVRGAVWDLAVDLRMEYPTFRRWRSMELSDANNRMLYIPPGFGHAFVALTDDVHLMYKCTNEYDSKLDAGIRWDDPDLGIQWPVRNPIVSQKDRELPFLKEVISYQ